MDMDFNTPQQERGARTIGTAVAGGSTTPVRGNPSPLLPLVGTEARKARQAQRREARLAQRQLLREPAVGTPAAVEEPVAVEEAQPPIEEPAAEVPVTMRAGADQVPAAGGTGAAQIDEFPEFKSTIVPEMIEDDNIADAIEDMLPFGILKTVLEQSNFEEIVSQYIKVEAPLLRDYDRLVQFVQKVTRGSPSGGSVQA